MTTKETIIREAVEEFVEHLSSSAPSMDKFEKASALNRLKLILYKVYDAGREEEIEKMLKKPEEIEQRHQEESEKRKKFNEEYTLYVNSVIDDILSLINPQENKK